MSCMSLAITLACLSCTKSNYGFSDVTLISSGDSFNWKTFVRFNSSNEGLVSGNENFVYYFAVPASPDTAEISLIKAWRKRWQLIIQMLCSVKYVNGGTFQITHRRRTESNINRVEVKNASLAFATNKKVSL